MERCPYCFKPLPEGGECSCHYEDSRNARIEEALRPGTVVGACYQIGAVLGQGGFGITYCGFDLDMQKVVAIKEFYPQGMVIRYGIINRNQTSNTRANYVWMVNPEAKDIFQKNLDLFYREAVALGRLDKQPNVVHAHRIFRENGTAYIVMEFVEGQPLKSIIQERGRIPEKELLPLMEPVLTALDRVHHEGILHRDIAPDNIMIENGVPILLDFGAARVEEDHHSSLLIGKRGFSAFEQMTGGVQDRRSDIYAMGATYYSALSGNPPQVATMRMMKDDVVPLKDLGFGISEKTSDAIAKAMALSPDDRWNTAAEFRDALKSNTISEDNEPVYLAALQLMNAGTAEGYAGALRLFKQIPGYKDSRKLAEESERKAAELQKQTNNDIPVHPGRIISKKQDKKLLFLITAAAALGIALFFLILTGKEQSGFSKQEMTLTALAAYKGTSTAAAVQAKTMQIVSTEQTAISEARMTGTAFFNEAKTKQAESAGTPVPAATNTPVPAATNTKAPAATNTPVPTATEIPEPISDDPEYLVRIGYQALLNGEYEKALKYLLPAAEAGNAEGQFWVGQMYEYGLGVTQSWETAAAYYQKSAVQGHANAQFSLGYRYEFGQGVEQSYKTAVKYYQMSADQGNQYAQFKLGRMYEFGQGIERSYGMAMNYYQLASDQGLAEAQNCLGVMYYSGTGIAQSYEKAVKFFQLAADQGEASAQNNLGFMYEKGYGVNQSYEMAIRYYRLSAEQGNEDAAEGLERLTNQ